MRISKPFVVRCRTNQTKTHSAEHDEEPEVQRRRAVDELRAAAPTPGSAAVRGTDAVVSRRMTGSCELTSQRT